jgi:hypothetical protein
MLNTPRTLCGRTYNNEMSECVRNFIPSSMPYLTKKITMTRINLQKTMLFLELFDASTFFELKQKGKISCNNALNDPTVASV